MELSINMNDHHPINPLPLSRTLQRHTAITSSSSSSSSVASSFLNLIYRRKKMIFILLCCSSLLMNKIFSVIPIVVHPSSSSSDQSSQNPLSNPDFNSTQILKSPFYSPIPPIPSPEKTITQEQILQFSLDSTVDSLKKSNTHILNLLNNQDLSGEQKNALMICQDTNEMIAEKLQMANRELNKAIDDLHFFLDHETACRRLRQIDMFLTMSVVDQDLCEQNLLKSTFILDLKIPASSMLSSSLELAKGIEKDCRKKIEETTMNVSPRHDGSVSGKKMKTYPWKKRETKRIAAIEEEEEAAAMDSDFDIDDEILYRRPVLKLLGARRYLHHQLDE